MGPPIRASWIISGMWVKALLSYFLMPFPDCTMRPLRMRALRRLTLDEYRLSHFTAVRLREKLKPAGVVMDEVHLQILGPELLNDIG